jgi:hypothetical protein
MPSDMNNPNTFSTTDDEATDIVDVIRKLRNDLIKDFLDERTLAAYVADQYKITDLSPVKVEFIKGELKKMLIAPVDVTWYKPILDDFQATGSAALSEGNEKLFYKEIENMLKRFIY